MIDTKAKKNHWIGRYFKSVVYPLVASLLSKKELWMMNTEF